MDSDPDKLRLALSREQCCVGAALDRSLPDRPSSAQHWGSADFQSVTVVQGINGRFETQCVNPFITDASHCWKLCSVYYRAVEFVNQQRNQKLYVCAPLPNSFGYPKLTLSCQQCF